MSKLIRPTPSSPTYLADPRSTGTQTRPRVIDILGLRGTKKD